VPTTCESLEAGTLSYARLLKYALACAVAVKVAGAASCRHRSVFGTTAVYWAPVVLLVAALPWPKAVCTGVCQNVWEEKFHIFLTLFS
jgi:hypothetical protein